MLKSQYTHLRNYLSLCCIALLMSSCSLQDLELDQGSKTPAAKEPTYFAKPTVYDEANSITVNFKAIAKYRPIISDQDEFYLGPISAQNYRAIPYAEFHIYNASGTRIQQGETTVDGEISAQIPKVLGDYTVKVFSRSFNSYVKVSVLKDLYENIPHHIQKQFSLSAGNTSGSSIDFTAPQSGNDLTAEADESIDPELTAGAFNIHYMIYATNAYIRRTIGKNAGPSSNSNDWFVADKVQAYWKKGFNPASYFAGPTAGSSSFYIPSENKLFILGGKSGNVKTMDTDHFDNSVIIHEYAHFLDNHYSNPSSRGGFHDGNAVIDARLAWSEGFANYFQSEVLNGLQLIGEGLSPNGLSSNDIVTNYIDTNGYFEINSPGGGPSLTFPLTTTGHCVDCFDSVLEDAGYFGNFREVSIARFLFKVSRSLTTNLFTRNSTQYSGGGADFKYIWQVFAGENKTGNTSTNPYPFSLAATSKYPVSNSGLGNYLLKKILTENSVSIGNFDSLLGDERQVASTAHYAQFLSSGSCSPVSIGPAQAENSATEYRSHQQANNDFYLINYNGSGGTLTLNYSVNTPAQPLNLDLILFKLTYDYIEDVELASGTSNATIVRQSRTTNSSESISLNNLSKGYYIVAVKVNAYNKSSAELSLKTANYTLTHNGATLCGIER